MFLQLLEWFPKLFEFLNNSKILSDAKKRKTIAKDYLAIYQWTSEVMLNAIDIQNDLKEAIENNINDEWYLWHLRYNIRKQLSLLIRLKDIFKQRDGLLTLINIYEDPEGEIVYHVISGKLSLIEILCNLLSDRTHHPIIPESFDLRDYSEDKDVDFKFGYGFKEELFFPTISETKFVNDEELLKHLAYLYDQIVRFDSIKKLAVLKESVGKIIKENFKIEELF